MEDKVSYSLAIKQAEITVWIGTPPNYKRYLEMDIEKKTRAINLSFAKLCRIYNETIRKHIESKEKEDNRKYYKIGQEVALDGQIMEKWQLDKFKPTARLGYIHTKRKFKTSCINKASEPIDLKAYIARKETLKGGKI